MGGVVSINVRAGSCVAQLSCTRLGVASVSYSQGIAQFADLFAPAGGRNAAAEFLARLAPNAADVMDIGAGAGGTSLALAAAGCRVTALEPDAEMYAVLLSRLALRHELQGLVTPIPRPAGFLIDKKFDVAACFSVVHLLQPQARTALVAYAAAQVRCGGLVVLEIPVESATRAASPWQCVASRQLGDMLVEQHASLQPASDGWWHTHWKFRMLLGGQPLHEVNRSFHWFPMPVTEATQMLESTGLRATQEFGGYDGTPFVPGQSRVCLVVARAT
jgi:hypothetical protein